jgi:NADH dehydrogenase [ubiquinone] 1 alpha subcomplex assembly factor 1
MRLMKIALLTLFLACLISCRGGDKTTTRDEPLSSAQQQETSNSDELIISNFSEDAGLGGWEVEDDAVMGGLSRGRLAIDDEGYAVFSGEISLENNGGFSSIQYYFDPIDVTRYTTALLRVRGDGKRYRFLVESERNDRHYYVYEFPTNGEWQTVEIPLAEMYPVYRGDRLDIPNFPGETIAQVRLFITGEKPDSFRIEIEKIWLQ